MSTAESSGGSVTRSFSERSAERLQQLADEQERQPSAFAEPCPLPDRHSESAPEPSADAAAVDASVELSVATSDHDGDIEMGESKSEHMTTDDSTEEKTETTEHKAQDSTDDHSADDEKFTHLRCDESFISVRLKIEPSDQLDDSIIEHSGRIDEDCGVNTREVYGWGAVDPLLFASVDECRTSLDWRAHAPSEPASSLTDGDLFHSSDPSGGLSEVKTDIDGDVDTASVLSRASSIGIDDRITAPVCVIPENTIPVDFDELSSNFSSAAVWKRDSPILFSWGVNEDGQLGDGIENNVRSPSLFRKTLKRPIRSVSFGESHSLFTSLSAVKQSLSPKGSPSSSSGSSYSMSVGAGETDRVALLLCSGANWDGECGFSPESFGRLKPDLTVPHSKQTRVFTGVPSSTPRVREKKKPKGVAISTVQVGCGSHYSMVLSEQGTLQSFGTDSHNGCYIGRRTEEWKGNKMVPSWHCSPVSPLFFQPVCEIAVGSHHCLVRTVFDQVFAFGKNSSAQLGLGYSNAEVYAKEMRDVSALRGIPLKQMECGNNFSLVLTKDGKKVYAFGSNFFGQCGQPEMEGGEQVVSVPTEVIGDWSNDDDDSSKKDDVPLVLSQIACGAYHSLVTDGRYVWAFGQNIQGQVTGGADEGDVIVAAIDPGTSIAASKGSSVIVQRTKVFSPFRLDHFSYNGLKVTRLGASDFASLVITEKRESEKKKKKSQCDVTIDRLLKDDRMALKTADLVNVLNATAHRIKEKPLYLSIECLKYLKKMADFAVSDSCDDPMLLDRVCKVYHIVFSSPSLLNGSFRDYGFSNRQNCFVCFTESEEEEKEEKDSSEMTTDDESMRSEEKSVELSKPKMIQRRKHVIPYSGFDLIRMSNEIWKQIVLDQKDNVIVNVILKSIVKCAETAKRGILLRLMEGDSSSDSPSSSFSSSASVASALCFRYYFLIICCDELLNPSFNHEATMMLNESLINMVTEKTLRNGLIDWITDGMTYDTRLWMVRRLQDLISMFIEVKDMVYHKYIYACIMVLNLFWESNQRIAERLSQNSELAALPSQQSLSFLVGNSNNSIGTRMIPVSSFYNRSITRNKHLMDLKQDYINWRRCSEDPSTISSSSFRSSAAAYSAGIFSFCNYGFLMDPDAKRQVIRAEQELTQISSAQASMRSGMFGGVFSGIRFPVGNPYFVMCVRRHHLLSDTLRIVTQICLTSPSEFRKPLKVKFEGEEGVDEGGVKKEFFQLIIREIFDVKYGMFSFDDETRNYWFNQHTLEDGNTYQMLGIIMGLGIYNDVLLDLHFPMIVYKKLCNEQCGLSDLKFLSKELYKSICDIYALAKDTHDQKREAEKGAEDVPDLVEMLCLNFAVTTLSFGETKTIELKPGGSEMDVNSDNAHEYCDLLIRYYLYESISIQYRAFADGFYKVVKDRAFALFNGEELENLICGSTILDFDALEVAAKYEGGYHAEHRTIRWFWSILKNDLNLNDQKKFLFFATGSDRAPLRGLSKLKLIIHRAGDDPYTGTQLPTAHTCFNALILPAYSSREVLKQKLLTAIQFSEGFGLK